MALHIPSIALGFVGAYVFSFWVMAVLLFINQRRTKKDRDKQLDQLLADVAIQCIGRSSAVPVPYYRRHRHE